MWKIKQNNFILTEEENHAVKGKTHGTYSQAWISQITSSLNSLVISAHSVFISWLPGHFLNWYGLLNTYSNNLPLVNLQKKVIVHN